MKEIVAGARVSIQVLLANGRAVDKTRLGISNQQYPSARLVAEGYLLQLAVRVAVAEELINEGGLYRGDLKERYQAEVERRLIEGGFMQAKEGKEVQS